MSLEQIPSMHSTCNLHNYKHSQFAGEETESKDKPTLYRACRVRTQAQLCWRLALLCPAPDQSEP